MQDLPRNMKLKAFNPHRDGFSCVHEASKVPPITPEAQAWFEEGLAVTRRELVRTQRDYKTAAVLWEKAAAQNHWKAIINLASAYTHGMGEGALGLQRDDERAVLLVEKGMQLGIPAAFDLMGTFHMEGRGVNADSSRAFAFWQLAADKGSPSAQAYLGSRLLGGYDQPGNLKWSNEPLGVAMLECSYAQGNAFAAYKFGAWINNIGVNGKPDYPRALQMLHDAVKFGSEPATGYIGSSFRAGDALVGGAADPSRGARYSMLGEALRLNKDLRFPNLDKMLPLPPAKLPKWDGQFESLVEATQGVRPKPAPAGKTSGLSYPPEHRAHLPEGVMLQVPAHMAARAPLPGFVSVLAPAGMPLGLARATASGYWQAVPSPALPNASPYARSLIAEFAALPPLYFAQGECMQLYIQGTNLLHDDGAHSLVDWHFAGQAVALQMKPDALVHAGVLRGIEQATNTVCAGDAPCPVTGIWQPQLSDAEHPWSGLLGLPTASNASPRAEAWKWQSFLMAGEAMPSLSAMGLPVQDAQLQWRLMQATPLGMEI
jgi:TPR repeat protein